LLQASSVTQDVIGEIKLSDWIDINKLGMFIGNDDPHSNDLRLHYNSPRKDQRKFCFQDLYFGPDIEDLCWLLGHYAAEGSVDKTMANFRVCGSKHDVDRCEKILKGFGDFRSHRGVTEKHTGTEVHYLAITSSVVIQIFAELFGLGARNKQIPSFVFHLDKHSKEAFLDGYNTGDGHAIELSNSTKQIATTISPKLLGGICLLNKYLGKDLSLTYREPDQFYDNHSRNGTTYSCYQDVTRRRNSKSVVQVNQGKTKEWVYDLIVPETHNFCDAAGMIVVHNCDEFYMEGSIERLRRCIRARPNASEFIPTFLHFYRDFYHIKAVHPEWNCWHQRVIRYQDGLRYHTHPVATDANGKCTYFDGGYQTKRYFIPELYVWHYGHAKGKEFHTMKQEFYKSELEKFKLSDGSSAFQKFDEKFLEFVNNSEDLSTILSYPDDHPEAIKSHPSFSHRENSYKGVDFKYWREAPFYNERELPTIPLLMQGPWRQAMLFYNVLDVA